MTYVYAALAMMASLQLAAAEDKTPPRDEAEEKKAAAMQLAGFFIGPEVTDIAVQNLFAAQVVERIAPLGIPEEDQKNFDLAGAEVLRRVTVQRFLATWAESYSRNLSLTEMKDAIAFYQSPAGQALLRKKEDIEMEKRKQQAQLLSELADAIRKRIEELKAEDQKQ